MSEEIFVNPDDILNDMWATCWKVELGYYFPVMYVAADCEQDALDEAVDYIKREQPEWYVLMTDEDMQEFLDDDGNEEDLVRAGNEGDPIRPDIADVMQIRGVKRGKLKARLYNKLMEEGKK